jgi:hypothetical protein
MENIDIPFSLTTVCIIIVVSMDKRCTIKCPNKYPFAR